MKVIVWIMLVIACGVICPGTSLAELRIDFVGHEGSGGTGKVATLYYGDLPNGNWKIVRLELNGTEQELGGFNGDYMVVDNAIAIEANGQRYGLMHRYDGVGIYGGVPYTNQPISGPVEVSLWEADGGGLSAAAPGSLYLICSNPELRARILKDKIVLSWLADAGSFKLQYTEHLVYGPWITVAELPRAVDARCVCTNQVNEGRCFFRLIAE